MTSKQEFQPPPPDLSSRIPKEDQTPEQLAIHGDVQFKKAQRVIGAAAFWMTIAQSRDRENKQLTQENEQLTQDNGQLTYEMTHCGLTGLLSRDGVFEMLEKNYQNNANGFRHLSFVDANGLKEVNDTVSHSFGDDYLKAIAKGISAVVRTSRDNSNDGCGRLSGDEFVLFGEVDYEFNPDNQNQIPPKVAEVIARREDEVRESVRVHTQAFIQSHLKEHKPKGESEDEIRKLLNTMLDDSFQFIAIGTEIYNGNDHQCAIDAADHKMYKDKHRTQASQKHDNPGKLRKN